MSKPLRHPAPAPADDGPCEDQLGWRRQHGRLQPYASAGSTGPAAPPTWQDAHPLTLDLYLRLRRIAEPQHAAGERFRELWHAARREPPSSLDYTPLQARTFEMSDATALADRRCRDAERAIPGPARLAVTAVCCWDRHAPIIPLRVGLDALARRFGLAR